MYVMRLIAAAALLFAGAGCYESKESVEYYYMVHGAAVRTSGGDGHVILQTYMGIEVEGESPFFQPYVSTYLGAFGGEMIPVKVFEYLVYGPWECLAPYTGESDFAVNGADLESCDLMPTLHTDGGEGLAERGGGAVELTGSFTIYHPSETEHEVSALVTMPSEVVLLSPRDGDTFAPSEIIDVAWEPAQHADFHVVVKHHPSFPEVYECIYFENTASEASFDTHGWADAWECIVSVLAVNGYTPDAFPPQEPPEPNVAGTEGGLFLAVSASDPVTISGQL